MERAGALIMETQFASVGFLAEEGVTGMIVDCS